jgi:hypothetical protein
LWGGTLFPLKQNTWLATISQDANRVSLEQQPRRASLCEIVQVAEQRDVAAVSIDAQLLIALSDENGFRSSDIKLRELLPADYRTWVASFNSLMGRFPLAPERSPRRYPRPLEGSSRHTCEHACTLVLVRPWAKR